jgi:hypothetical protein
MPAINEGARCALAVSADAARALSQHCILLSNSNCCAILNPLRYLIEEVFVSDMPTKHQNARATIRGKNEKEMDCHTVFAAADRDRCLCHHADVAASCAEGGG